MVGYVLALEELDVTQVALAGAKGANLGALSRIKGVRIPPGFCITISAFQRVMQSAPAIDGLLDRLSRLLPSDRDTIRALSLEIRRTVEALAIPVDLAAVITRFLAQFGAHAAYAVRSSATGEDLPTASFAGQLDTYLNVVGQAEILEHVRRCWASLFTERAVTYRLRNGFDHRRVHMAVVVQQMVFPEAAGVLFTADPVNGHRKVVSIEASFGLGEALVSGLVNPDVFTVRDNEIVATTIGTKRLAIVPSATGGTQEQVIAPEQQTRPALLERQVLQLAQLGRRVESHFGHPQDIEWCISDERIFIVQSRPITTLFPIPEALDQENHVYVSVGHQQMMTDPMKPLGLSVWQLTTPRPMAEAGGRLFVDVTQILATPGSRAGLLATLGKSDPRIRDALEALLDRGDFIPSRPNEAPQWAPPGGGSDAIETDPAIVAELIARSERSIAALVRDIRMKTGSALLDFIRTDIEEQKQIQSDPTSMQVIMAGMKAAWWLNDHIEEWLGEKNAADAITQSVPGNVTSEMGLALLNVADVIRPYPEVVEFLQQVEDDGFLSELPTRAGGRQARSAIQGWLDKYGMRGVGEIDITRPRWSERPLMLVPIILAHIATFEPDEGERRFQQGVRSALKKEQDLLRRVRDLAGGEQKALETKRMIDRVRTFAGYREYPKYRMVTRYFAYKLALMEEADRLVAAGVLQEKEDLFYIRFEELQDVVRTQQVDEQLIQQRKDAFTAYQSLTPPRVVTSDGEVVSGANRRDDVPAGALAGLAVSGGTVEGRARVILDVTKADLEAGDILVTAYTDPSWTPLFVAIKGLVTEVGGLMTHGAVIAREYGLPAVVGVEHVTRLIRDGQRIRVNGTDGYVEILP